MLPLAVLELPILSGKRIRRRNNRSCRAPLLAHLPGRRLRWSLRYRRTGGLGRPSPGNYSLRPSCGGCQMRLRRAPYCRRRGGNRAWPVFLYFLYCCIMICRQIRFPDADYRVIMKLTEREKASSLSNPRTPELKDDETTAGKAGGNLSGLSQASGDLHEGISYD